MKKYTSQQINSLSWQEWNELMAKELNAAGFKTEEFSDGQWKKRENIGLATMANHGSSPYRWMPKP